MKTISEKAYAKINLAIDVIKRRGDGYHELEMIMQQIDLYDEVLITKMDFDIVIKSDDKKIPLDARNLAYKAAQKYFTYTGIKKGAEIFIQKKIPIEAGLAGGSSDAAAVLKGLNRMYGDVLTVKDLMKIGVEIGADVPFCLMGGTALSTGIGEILSPINCPHKICYVLVKPSFGVSTKQVFDRLKIDEIESRPLIKDMISYIEKCDIENLANGLCNVLEGPVIKMHPEIAKLKMDMTSNGALASIMSGSGSTVLGICKDIKMAKIVADEMKKCCETVFVVESIESKFQLERTVK